VQPEEENSMKAFAYVLAAIATIAIAAPTIASAETVIIKRGHHPHWHHRYHSDWHPHHHHHHDRTVVIKHRY
jgi:hypothetical protein